MRVAPNDEQKARLEYWTNEDGKLARSKATPGQREVNREQIRVYRAYVDTERWYPLTASPACWLENGTFGNGNNRAQMIAELPDGVEVPILVAHGIPNAALEYVDSGRPRTLGQHLRYGFPERTESACKVAASILSIVMNYSGPGTLPRVDIKPDAAEAVRYADAHSGRLFEAAAKAVRIATLEGKVTGGIMTARTLGAVLYWLNDEDAVRFFEGMALRSGLGRDDPREQLLAHYRRPENEMPRGSQGRTTTLQRVADLLGCWDAYTRADTRWRAWDRKEQNFRHPPVDHRGERAA